MGNWLPGEKQWKSYLGLSDGDSAVADSVAGSLMRPLESFFASPGKALRGEIVGLGYRMSESPERPLAPMDEALCSKAVAVVEALHAGSLVVDDIEDGSQWRRGQETLHRTYGVPVALNAGNWLYFWPLYWISQWKLDPPRERALYRLCHDALLQAHFGQALDVGTPISQVEREKVEALCFKSLELKTGALMALGMGLGAALGRATEDRLEKLRAFAVRLGVALQMFDDIGNLRSTVKGKPNPKQFEDLRLQRPTFVWAVASRLPERFSTLCESVKAIPDTTAVEKWIGVTDFFRRGTEEACRYLDQSVESLFADLDMGNAVKESLGDWATRLKSAYA